MSEDTFEDDPQDNSGFSQDMDVTKPEQREYVARSVFDGLSEIGLHHGKLFGTGGRRADMLRFDLTAHSVYAGNTCIICRGRLMTGKLETHEVRVLIPDGSPWLTEDEQGMDPKRLFEDHYLSRPNGSEKFMHCNFPAKDVDSMTDDEVIRGIPRSAARIRLEAWMLCAAVDGTLQKYVTGRPDWRPGDEWWSARGDDGHGLVIKTAWWSHSSCDSTDIGKDEFGRTVLKDGGATVAILSGRLAPDEQRTLQMAATLRRSLMALSDAAFRLQVRTKTFDCDPIINEATAVLSYIENGNRSPADGKNGSTAGNNK